MAQIKLKRNKIMRVSMFKMLEILQNYMDRIVLNWLQEYENITRRQKEQNKSMVADYIA